jgi:hypothetical protein
VLRHIDHLHIDFYVKNIKDDLKHIILNSLPCNAVRCLDSLIASTQHILKVDYFLRFEGWSLQQDGQFHS